MFHKHRGQGSIRAKVDLGASKTRQMGHTPSTALPEKFRKDPGNPLRAFPGIPLGSTQRISRIVSPAVRLGTPLFSEVVPERASQSRCHGIPSSTGGIPDQSWPDGFLELAKNTRPAVAKKTVHWAIWGLGGGKSMGD